MPLKKKKQYTLAELTQGLDVTIEGDPNYLISGVNTIQQAEPQHITFLMNPLYKKYLSTTQAGAVILSKSDALDCRQNTIIARDPYYTYALVAAYFDHKSHPPKGIHPTAVIGDKCKIDSSACISAHCVIGQGVKIGPHVEIGPGCTIGDFSEIAERAKLHSHVTLYDRIKVGKRVIIASGAVIGSDGFGIAKHEGIWHKIPQLGSVVIGDDVEIGANCAIDRGAIEDTIIEKGVKLDNLIQVGHNVRIGENTAIAGCAAIAGSTAIGKNCLIGGMAGIAGHVIIADNVVITGGSAITKSIHDPGIYSSGVGGVVTNLEWRKNSARLHRLEHLQERIKTLESALKALTTEMSTQ